MQPIHHRMPVMLSPAQWEVWPDPRLALPEDFSSVLRLPPTETMSAVPVSARVNSVRYDAPDCIAPAAINETIEDAQQLSLGW